MKIDILTIFPEMFEGWKNTSIIKKAIGLGLIEINVINFRNFTKDKNFRIDDYPCGGGAGLVMQIQPIVDCLKTLRTDDSYVILMSPRGNTFKQLTARKLQKKKHLIFICGHYEGIDERVNDYVDEMISIGDFILTGGELPAMIISDAIIRLSEGVINQDSTLDESFENGLLEYPQYTIPRIYDDKQVPDILFTGNHQAISKWRLKESLKITKKYRPDLLENREFTKTEKILLKEIEENNEEPNWLMKVIEKAHKFKEVKKDEE